MKRPTTTLGLLLLVVAVVVEARSGQGKPEPSSITGTWDCVAHGSTQGDVPFTLTLHQDKETVTGTIATGDGELPITSGSFKNSALEILVETDQAKYQVTGTLDGGQLKGHWSKKVILGAGDDQGGDQAGDWEGKVSASAKPTAQ